MTETPGFTPRTVADLERYTGGLVEQVTIRCEHAVNGRIRTPRIAVAARWDRARGWFFGGTLSDALDLDTRAASTDNANVARFRELQMEARRYSLATVKHGEHGSVVLECSTCNNRAKFVDGHRLATVFEELLADNVHTVKLAELRARYSATPPSA